MPKAKKHLQPNYDRFVSEDVPILRTRFEVIVFTHHCKIIYNDALKQSIDYYPKGEKAVLIQDRRTIKSVEMTPESLFLHLGF